MVVVLSTKGRITCRQCNVVCGILYSVPLLHYLVLVPFLSTLSVVIVFLLLLLLLLYLFLRGFI